MTLYFRSHTLHDVQRVDFCLFTVVIHFPQNVRLKLPLYLYWRELLRCDYVK